MAAAVMVGKTLDELGLQDEVLHPYVSVKEAVFPFSKLPGVDLLLGPEMRSTGEVMGIADGFGMAFAKAQAAVDGSLPLEGAIFITVNDNDKDTVTPIARRFHALGFKIFATQGTARHLRGRGIPTERVLKVHEGRPNAIDLLVSGQIHMLVNTPLGQAHPAGRLCHAPRRAAASRGLHHDDVRRVGGLRCHHRAAEPRG